MAKKDTKLELLDSNVTATPAADTNTNNKKKNTSKKKDKKRRDFGKFFRDIISELKKVSWASFKSTKGNSGVLSQTGTVLIVVLIFMIVVSLFDAGLTQLVSLLLNVNA